MARASAHPRVRPHPYRGEPRRAVLVRTGSHRWANLTAPTCYFLDWEDWRHLPSWHRCRQVVDQFLTIPALADQIRRHRHADLESRTGRLMALFYCSQMLAAAPDCISPAYEQAKSEAARLIDEVTRVGRGLPTFATSFGEAPCTRRQRPRLGIRP